MMCVSQVEVSLQSSFQPGMKLEVANKSGPDSYWVATIITTCGQLLLLRYSGYGEDRKADFWCDVMTAELHPVGWCTRNGKTLMPPEGKGGGTSALVLIERCGSLASSGIRKGATTIASELHRVVTVISLCRPRASRFIQCSLLRQGIISDVTLFIVIIQQHATVLSMCNQRRERTR